MPKALSIFAQWAPRYASLGFWPRPVAPGTKACRARRWTQPDKEIPPEVRKTWLKLQGQGIGLLMGSPFPDGTSLGALDIDHDNYTRIGQALLRDPPCGRVGKKGAVFFVRVRGAARNFEFRVKGDKDERFGKVAECLFTKRMCLIPPTLHPNTRQAYRWIGEPLHEVDFQLLPIVEI
jgi:hypothetical protein